MPQSSSVVTRRAVLKLGLAAAGSFGVSLQIPALAAAAPVIAATNRPAVTVATEDAPAPRYQFDCVTPIVGFAPLSRLEEVWARSHYVTFTDCVVSYMGEEAFALTPEESAIVDVVGQAGGDVSDREATFMLVLAASTRIDPSRLTAKLDELGPAIVAGMLALAPEQPQAHLFARWLDGPDADAEQ